MLITYLQIEDYEDSSDGKVDQHTSPPENLRISRIAENLVSFLMVMWNWEKKKKCCYYNTSTVVGIICIFAIIYSIYCIGIFIRLIGNSSGKGLQKQVSGQETKVDQ